VPAHPVHAAMYHNVTRSTGTVHTSAKARLTRISIRIRDSDRHQNLIICSLAHCQHSLKIHANPFRKFLRKVANRQTSIHRQTNNDDYISSLAEVTSVPMLCNDHRPRNDLLCIERNAKQLLTHSLYDHPPVQSLLID